MAIDDDKVCDASGCKGIASWVRYCGAYVCAACGKHFGHVRCFCGWAASGGDGRRELIEWGETIDPEDY